MNFFKLKFNILAIEFSFIKFDKDIVKLVSSCESCAMTRGSPAKAPLHMWEEPEENCDRIHIDYADPYLGKHILIAIDAKSKWLEAQAVNEAPTSDNKIWLLQAMFSIHGFPQFLVSDNATYFTRETFCEVNGNIQKFSAPGHPSTNGLAERAVQTIKNKLKAMEAEPINIHQKLRKILQIYRATPVADGISPAERYLKRKIRIHLDAMLPPKKMMEFKPVSKFGTRQIKVGDSVQSRFFIRSKPTWRFGTVIEKLEQLMKKNLKHLTKMKYYLQC